MASTRNKNTIGNYKTEQSSLQQQRQYLDYQHAANGRPMQSNFAGDGLIMGRMVPTELSHNPNDIESFLWGIGSTNLVDPMAEVKPQIRNLQSLSIMDRTPVFLPQPLIVDKDQRPLPS